MSDTGEACLSYAFPIMQVLRSLVRLCTNTLPSVGLENQCSEGAPTFSMSSSECSTIACPVWKHSLLRFRQSS